MCILIPFGLSAGAVDDKGETVQPLATGLIREHTLTFKKKSTTYSDIRGTTVCYADVVRCGMIDIVIQRRKTSSASWSDYLDLDDKCLDASSCTYSRSIGLPEGYQYRVSWKHYAKKNIFTTEKIPLNSNVVYY